MLPVPTLVQATTHNDIRATYSAFALDIFSQNSLHLLILIGSQALPASKTFSTCCRHGLSQLETKTRSGFLFSYSNTSNSMPGPGHKKAKGQANKQKQKQIQREQSAVQDIIPTTLANDVDDAAGRVEKVNLLCELLQIPGAH